MKVLLPCSAFVIVSGTSIKNTIMKNELMLEYKLKEVL